MKKFATFISLIFLTTFLSAVDKPYFVHGDVGTMGAFPMLGIGVRTKTGMHSFDVVGLMYPIKSFPFHIKGLYLLYPKEEGFYLGGGLGFLNEPESLKQVTGSYEGALGYQWNSDNKKTQSFLELNVIAPFVEPQGTMRAWPGLTFGVGF